MVKTGKRIAKHRILIVLIGILLLIPSVIGTIKTRINYDILSYLPESLETVKGQDVMVDEFGTGAFSMVVVEDMPLKDVQKLKNKFEEIEHVKKVLWYDDIADISVPTSMMPKDLKNIFFADDSTMMLVLFDNTTSSDEAMEAVTNMRAIVDKPVLYQRYVRCRNRYQESVSAGTADLRGDRSTVFFHRAGDYRNILCGADPVPALYRNLDPV